MNSTPKIDPNPPPRSLPEVTWSCIVRYQIHHYYNYCYSQIMRGTLSEEILRAKESYEHLPATHRIRFYSHRADNIRVWGTLFKEAVQTCGQKINYCRVGYHHKK